MPFRRRDFILLAAAFALLGAAAAIEWFAPAVDWLAEILLVGAVALATFAGGWVGGLASLVLAPLVLTRNGQLPLEHVMGEWIECTVIVAVMAIARRSVVRFRKSESKLRALLEAMDDVILVLDDAGRYVETAATTTRRVHDVFPKETADWIVDQIHRALQQRHPIEVDYSLPIDGRTVWFSASVAPLNESSVIWVARDITARKQAEDALQKANAELEARVAERTEELTKSVEALRTSEERYRSVFDQADEIICTLSREGLITSLNPAFERVLGWPCDQWIGKAFLGLVVADGRPYVEALLASALGNGLLAASRAVVLSKSGSRVVLEISMVEQMLHEKSVGFVLIGRDITAREVAEEKLRRSERQLAEAEKAARLGSWEHDLIENAMWWSEEAYRIFGVPPVKGPITYKSFLRSLHEDDRRLIEEFRRHVVARGEYSCELRIHAVDGVKRVLSCHGRLVTDARGSGRRIIGAFQDVTEQHRAQEQLRENEERFRLVTLATSDAIWDADLRTGRMWQSEAFRNFGYEGGVLENGYEWWLERLHPDDRERAVTAHQEAIDSGQPSWSQEFRMRRADGTYAYVLDRGYIVRDADKKPVRLLGAIMDVTERRQLEEQLEQAKRVSSLGRVAASIAHEFNNVLMGIQPNVEVIQRASPTGLRQVTDNITSAVQRGKRITDEILRFTRPAEPHLQSVAVRSFLEKWREENHSLLGPAVHVAIEADDLHVLADPLQLSQLFTNLALNARDAMQDRTGTLAIAAHVSKSFGSFPFGVVKTPDRFVHFTVRDEGCGISGDRLPDIFEPLFTTKKTGVGLGLAIVYQVVKRHDGHIFVESELGQGSVFHVFIPATLPPVQTASPPVAAGPVSIRKLLLVEDEVAVASGIAMLLEMEGVKVEIVSTGRESIPAIERFGPDAVVLDIGLPDMDGVGVYLEIERRWPDLPVLFSTGHGDSAKLQTYLARPNVGFILKPYDFEAMNAALAGLFKKRAQKSG